MIGIAEQNLCPSIGKIAMRDPFHRALRTNRHECRRLNIAMRSAQHTATGATILMRYTKTKVSI
jgi:hypothetical protein